MSTDSSEEDIGEFMPNIKAKEISKQSAHEEEKVEAFQPQALVESSSEEEIDLEMLEPAQVNWFKFIIDNHLKLMDEDGNPTVLNSADSFVTLLNILLNNKPNEEIQEELLNLVGFHNFELLE